MLSCMVIYNDITVFLAILPNVFTRLMFNNKCPCITDPAYIDIWYVRMVDTRIRLHDRLIHLQRMYTNNVPASN